ncbi:hypothetical protein HA402_011032 [Bradysia odoriphaga]|nr:hypothetical protein HA402_011032 [Bradysia odoriphaga]
MVSIQSELVDSYNHILTIDELNDIVRKTLKTGNQVNVTEYEIKPDQNAFGYLGEYFRLTVHVESAASTSSQTLKYFIKSLPINDEAQRKYIESYGMFQKEGVLYNDLLSKLGGTDSSSVSAKWRPECFLARSDLLVFEDLNFLGYSHLEHRTALQSPHIECTLNSLAKMHAAGIAYETREATNIGSKFKDALFEPSIGLTNTWHLVGLQAVKFIAPLTPNFAKYRDWSTQKFDKLIAPIYEMMLESTKYRNVLCHRDLWQSNLVYKFERNVNDNIDQSKPIECVLIDYQICRYLPPVVDVIGLISVSTRLEHRKQYYGRYLRYYYDTLVKELNEYKIEASNELSWEEFVQSSIELKLLPLAINAVCIPLTTLSSEILLSLKTENPARYMRTMTVNRHEFILEYMEKDAEYKEIVMESYSELLDCMFGIKE